MTKHYNKYRGAPVERIMWRASENVSDEEIAAKIKRWRREVKRMVEEISKLHYDRDRAEYHSLEVRISHMCQKIAMWNNELLMRRLERGELREAS